MKEKETVRETERDWTKREREIGKMRAKSDVDSELCILYSA